MKPALDINAQLRRDIRTRDWTRVHIDGDRQPAFKWWPRRWTYSGAGSWRKRGAHHG